MKEKIRILILAANPRNTTPLRLEEEIREIEEKIWKGTQRDAFSLIPALAVRVTDLQDALLKHRPHIVHVSGHGNDAGGIYLENDAGNSKVVSRKALTRLFNILKREIRVIVLNVCNSADQAKLLADAVGFAIGMNGTIHDKSAIVFAAHFYKSLAFGCSIKEAFELAQSQLAMAGIRGVNTPQLLVREGMDAATFHLVQEQSKEAETATATKPEDPSGQRSINAGTINHSINVTGDRNKIEYKQSR